MYIECASNRAYRGESLGPGMAQSARQQLSRSAQPLVNRPESDPNLSVEGPGSRRPPVQNPSSVFPKRTPLSPRRHLTAQQSFVPEWAQSALDDEDGCCAYLGRVVSRDRSLPPRAAHLPSQRVAKVLHSRLADPFVYPAFFYLRIIVNPYRNASCTSVATSVFQI